MFKYLGLTGTNTKDIFDKILSSRLIAKKLKVNAYKTVILPVVLHDFEPWSPQRGAEVFENKVLRKIFGHGRLAR